MTDPSMTPETPGIAETANFLRRFADMMSVGQNATYLNHAAVLLEDLTARLTAALDEEQLWRYKYETIAHHADAVEAECEALKNDIDGHLNIISSTIAERDTLRETLQARDVEISGLRDALQRERDALVVNSQAHEATLTGLRSAFDRERAALHAAAEARGQEFDQLRQQHVEQARAREAALAELRLGFVRERDDLAARLKVAGDELASLRVVSERECDGLLAKVAALEAKRAELRTAFDRISHLQNQAVDPQAAAARSMAEKSGPEAEAPSRPTLAVGETDVVVPRATLRQVRSQFEYLAHEFTGAGDVASQVMCELGAFTMELALGAGRKADPLPVGDVALSILASPGSTAAAGAETR
jgi:chromosome segregation ATPase